MKLGSLCHMLNKNLPTKIRVVCIALGLVVLIFLWEIAIATNVVSSLLLPHPLAVCQALGRLLGTSTFWRDIGSTVTTWVLGIAIGTMLGGPIGLGIAINRYIWAALEPWVEFLRALPSVVLVPIVSLILGVGATSRLACAALVVFLLMVSSASAAVRTTRSSYIRLAIAWRATPTQRLVSFYFPSTLSHMAVALRAAIPLALIVTVAADMLIATDAGIGRILMDSAAVFDMNKLYAGVIIVGLLGYTGAMLSSFIERKTIHWSGT